MNKKDIKSQTIKFKPKDEDCDLYEGYADYKDQFKPWINHKKAVLILESEDDELFLEKLYWCEATNSVISSLSNLPLISHKY